MYEIGIPFFVLVKVVQKRNLLQKIDLIFL